MEKRFGNFSPYNNFKYLTPYSSNCDNIMTCIEMLKLSNTKYAAMSDERETWTGLGRYADVASKIDIFNPYVAMSAGRVDNKIHIINRFKTRFKEKMAFEQAIEDFKNIFYEVYHEKVEGAVLAKYGSSWDKFEKGQFPKELEKQLIEELNFFAGRDGFGTVFIFGGYNPDLKDVEIYHISAPKNANPLRHYAVEGSGFDRAQLEISDYIESLPKNRRDNIPIGDGIRVLSRGLMRATKNVGVGGVPEIAIGDDSKAKKLNYKTCILACNIAVKEIKREITDDRSIELFERLVEKKETPEYIAKKFPEGSLLVRKIMPL